MIIYHNVENPDTSNSKTTNNAVCNREITEGAEANANISDIPTQQVEQFQNWWQIHGKCKLQF